MRKTQREGGRAGRRAERLRQRKGQNKTEAAAKETHFMARSDFFKGLVTPHNSYCQTGGWGEGGPPLLFSVGLSDRSNKHLVVSKLDIVNVLLTLVRQKTL